MNTQLLRNSGLKILILGIAVLVTFTGLPGCLTSTDQEADDKDTSPSSPAEESTGAPTQTSEVPRISKEELLQKIQNGDEIIIVDTRQQVYYDQGHIKGAISVPYAEITLRKWQPTPSKEIILYCD